MHPVTQSILTIGLLFFVTVNSFCQDGTDGLVVFDDTLQFSKVKTDTLSSLDKISGTVTFANKANNTWGFVKNGQTIVLKQADKYFTFQIGATIDTAQEIKFGNADKKLLIKFWESGGASFDDHGWGDYSQGFLIVDIDKLLQLASFYNYYSHQQWDNTTDTPSDDNICQNYSVSINGQTISFVPQNTCTKHDSQLKTTIKNPQTVKYTLTTDRLIKAK